MKFKNYLKEMDVDLSNGEISPSSGPSETPQEKPAAVEAIRMDIPLFIRVLEYAHENAKTDQELHELTERAAMMSKDRTLTMEDYEALVAELRREPDDPNKAEYPASTQNPAAEVAVDPRASYN